MSGLVRSATAGSVFAWMDGPPGAYEYDPRKEARRLEEWSRARAQAEAERQKLCADLLANTPTTRLGSLKQGVRLWWNNCSKSASKSETPKPVAESKADSKQAAEPEPKYRWSRNF